jgi:hypothetical protein
MGASQKCVHTIVYSREGQLLFTGFYCFIGVHAFAAKGRLRFEGQKKQKPFSIPRCLGHKTPHIKKSDRCFWGIVKYGGFPHMIPKSNARK